VIAQDYVLNHKSFLGKAVREDGLFVFTTRKSPNKVARSAETAVCAVRQARVDKILQQQSKRRLNRKKWCKCAKNGKVLAHGVVLGGL